MLYICLFILSVSMTIAQKPHEGIISLKGLKSVQMYFGSKITEINISRNAYGDLKVEELSLENGERISGDQLNHIISESHIQSVTGEPTP